MLSGFGRDSRKTSGTKDKMLLDSTVISKMTPGTAEQFLIWPDPYPIAPRDKISRAGKPLAPTLSGWMDTM